LRQETTLASDLQSIVRTRRAIAQSTHPLVIGSCVALAYVLAAKLGFTVASAAEQVTTVWAPSGIGIASLLIWGTSLWPAVWLGAVIANAGTDAPLWTSATIATGNTLEAVVAVWALHRLTWFDPALNRVRDVISFIVIAAIAATMVSATIGTASLCIAGEQQWTRFPELWSAWWLGDALGALVVAPVIMTGAQLRRRTRGSWLEVALLIGGAMVATHLVFAQLLGSVTQAHPLEYVIFPFVITAAVRSGMLPTTLVVLGASVIAIWNTALGSGPFASSALHQSLILLQTFMGVLAGTGLLLAAAIAERTTGERRRAAAHAVGDVLISAPNLTDASPAILKAIGENLEWHLSALWLVDNAQQRLRCVAVWSESPQRTAAFSATTMATNFAPGVGLPGRVWTVAAPVWIEDVAEDANYPRAPLAREAGLHGAFGFPIKMGAHLVGVIECYNRNIVTPDADLLGTMATVGNQIGLFLGREHEEAAVAEAQRRTSAIVETALDAVIGMNHEGVITEFNPAAERMFGYTRETVVGRQLAELLIPPSLRQAHRDGLRRYLLTGAGTLIDRRFETTAQRADGHEFPVEIAIARVRGEEPPTFTGFVRDLTARVRAEQEREHLLVSEATARSDAELANRAKDEFLATLSHELRTPLNAIVGWTHMLLDGSMDEVSTKRALQVIARNARLQAQLVADILDVSRIITGGVTLDVQCIDLGAVIDAALDAVRPAADAKQVQLRAEIAEVARPVEGDAQRLQQVIWNLLANAVKFSGSGGVVTIQLTASDADTVRIVVSDSGVGIAPEFLPHVFDRFRQADGSTSRQHGGLGLGLAIVRHLVELHGGRVRAESAGAGRGATFAVELPRKHGITPSLASGSPPR
jgi:PAS domain S-box-containing protein